MKSRLFKIIFLIYCMLISTWDTKAQDEKFKALFIYNFTKYIEWPAEKQSSEFIITIYGSNSVIPELKIIAGRMKAGTKPIIIKQTDNLSVIPLTNILFVSKDKTNDISQVIENLNARNVLLITEKTNACSLGASLNFISKNGNLNFEVQPANIQKAGLKVNSQLLTLGTVL